MPLFIHQRDLFDERDHRQRVADGDDALPDGIATLPPQSAVSSALVIQQLLRQLETVTGMLDEALMLHIYEDEQEAAESYHAQVIEDAWDMRNALRMHWPGLRYSYYY